MVLLGLLFLAVVLALDLAFPYMSDLPLTLYWMREGLIVATFLLYGVTLYGRRYIEEKNILYKLRTVFFALIGLYAVVLVPRMLFSRSSSFSLHNLFAFYPALETIFLRMLISVFFTLFMINILILLRTLVFYKSRRKTHRLFHASLVLLGGLVVYGHLSRTVVQVEWTFQGRTPFEWILLGFLLLFLVILSFRSSWVTYLNRRQKYLAFWGGLAVLPAIILVFRSNVLDEISRFSLTVGAFDSFVFYFITIYLAFTEINLLLHLPTASIFDKKMNEIASLQNLSRMISTVLEYNRVIEKVTELARDVLRADGTWLEMVENGSEVRVVSSNGLSQKELARLPVKFEKSITSWVLENRRSLLINEISRDSRSSYLRKWKKNIGSLLSVPLVSQNRVLGVLHAIKHEEFGFDQDDQDMLQAFADQATVAIENARLVEESLEKERLEQELRVAHDTQLKLLPKQMPSLPDVEIEALCVTANEVGGDYFDFVELGSHSLGIVIADVSGKGISAAFYMAELKGIVNSFARIYTSPKELLIRINETLYENVDRQTFVSMVYALLDTSRRKLYFCRAGHEPVFYYSARHDRLELLQPQGIGLALDSGNVFNRLLEERNVKWRGGDFFLFYTDGLIEARNQSGEEFGFQRLYELVWKYRDRSARELKEVVKEEVLKFIGHARPHDDFSLILVRAT